MKNQEYKPEVDSTKIASITILFITAAAKQKSMKVHRDFPGATSNRKKCINPSQIIGKYCLAK